MDIRIGDEVYWHDPSGYYLVCDIYSKSKTIENSDTILLLKNGSGEGAEVFAYELEEKE